MNRLKIFLLGLVLVPWGVAFATSFMAQPFPDTVHQAATIIRGTAGNSFSDWGLGPDGHKRLYTYYDFQVQEVFKGDVKAPKIEVRELGGEKDGIGMQVAGAAHFTKGEDVVVMLGKRNPDKSYDVQGLMTGKFAIRRDESGDEYLVGALPDPDAVFPDGSGVGAPAGPRRWTLRDLRRIVASQAQSAAVSPKIQTAVSPRPSPQVSVRPSPAPTAPHLHPVPAQGADQSQVNHGPGFTWIAWLSLILLIGVFWTWWITRSKE